MGLFDRQNKLVKSWISVTEESQIDQLIKASYDKPQVIFKDSVSCGISVGVKSRLVNDWANLSEEVDFHYLDLLSYRSVSNYIAQVSQVIHQSPQIIIFHRGAVVANTSHHAINVNFIRDAVAGIS